MFCLPDQEKEILKELNLTEAVLPSLADGEDLFGGLLSNSSLEFLNNQTKNYIFPESESDDSPNESPVINNLNLSPPPVNQLNVNSSPVINNLNLPPPPEIIKQSNSNNQLQISSFDDSLNIQKELKYNFDDIQINLDGNTIGKFVINMPNSPPITPVMRIPPIPKLGSVFWVEFWYSHIKKSGMWKVCRVSYHDKEWETTFMGYPILEGLVEDRNHPKTFVIKNGVWKMTGFPPERTYVIFE